MYEDRTFQNILNEMLSTIPDDRDKRQGSIIYDSLAPMAAKLAKLYVDLNTQQKIIFLDTTMGDFLIRKAAEIPLKIKSAEKATRHVNYQGALPLGSRFFTDSNIYYKCIEPGIVECEAAGTIGNNPLNGTTLIPLEDIPGLVNISLGNIIIPGKEIESDEDFKQRIYTHLQDPEYNSNKPQIISWCKEIEGVGEVKIIYDTQNSIIILTRGIITDSKGNPAAPEIITAVQKYIDPDSQGLGEGKADVGVRFLAQSAIAKPINISAKIVLANNKSIEEANLEFTNQFETYLHDIIFDINRKDNQVRYNKIGGILSNMVSIVDYEVSSLLVNGSIQNISIADIEVATKGGITLYV